MHNPNTGISRRQLFARTSKAAVAGAITGSQITKAANTVAKAPSTQPTGKIINYNPKMKYRRLGKTHLMLSEVSLGGHWRNRNAGRFWSTFENDVIPADVAKNRTEVISACIDAGINYLDITTPAECLSYGIALKRRREKFIVGADDHRLGIRHVDNHSLRAQMHNIDECLRRLQTDYLDIWRVQAKTDDTTPDTIMEIAVEIA